MQKKTAGFSLLELLIVISIVILLLVLFPMSINFRAQIDKGYDVVRKNNVTDLKNRLEEFYADNNRYPTSNEICYNSPNELINLCPLSDSIQCCNVCGKRNTPDGIAKYINPLPCDPQFATKDYVYTTPLDNTPQWYALYSKLSLPDINASPASCKDGCGPKNNFQLGLSSDNKLIE